MHQTLILDNGLQALRQSAIRKPPSLPTFLESPSTQLWLKVLLPRQESMKAIELAFFQWIGSSGECLVPACIAGSNAFAYKHVLHYALLRHVRSNVFGKTANGIILHIVTWTLVPFNCAI